MDKNPYVLSFGRKPHQYIERGLVVDEIVDELESDIVQNQCFMLCGVRGSGKTVTMTAIESRIREQKDWIVIGLNTERDMLNSLVAKIYDHDGDFKKFFEKGINLSAFGIGVSVKNVPPTADIEAALEKILTEMKKKNKRLLVTVDEVCNTASMKQFAGSFQIMVRQELPIYLVMAGLYENIHNLEDEKNLTFLYRAPKYHMAPLNFVAMKNSYRDTLGIGEDEAGELARQTKGYPFAYQALGKYVWDSEDHKLTEDVLMHFDEALEAYVYNKIWAEMSEKDRFFMSFIAQKESMKTAELLELTGQKKNEFSQYKERLANKGVIDDSQWGVLSVKLPRFSEFVKRKLEAF